MIINFFINLYKPLQTSFADVHKHYTMVRWVFFALAFAGSCPITGQNTFQQQINGVNGLFTFEQTADNHYWLGTFLGKIIRLDANGQWLGGYDLHKGDTTKVRFIYDLERTPDNGVWALYDRNNANTALDDYLILARLNANGQPLWQTSVHYGEVLHWAHNRLATDPAGNAYVVSIRSSAPGSGQPSRTIFAKVGPDGTLQWLKALSNQGVTCPRAFQRLSDGSFLLCGNGQLTNSFGFLLRVSADGEVLWSRQYPRFLFKAFTEMPDGGWAFAATKAGPLPQDNCVVRMDAQGNVLWAKRLIMPPALNWIPAIARSPTGDVLIGNYETHRDQAAPDLICLSSTGDFRWARRYDVCHNYGISNLLVTNDGGLAALRYRTGGPLLLKTDALGQCASCPADTMVIPLEDLYDTPLDLQWQVEDRSAPGPAECDYHPFTAQIKDFCGQEKPITGISLTANQLCLYQPLGANAVGPGLADSYQWFFAGGVPASQAGVPGVGGVQFVTPGPALVTLATVTGFCRDTFSASLAVIPGPAPFELGPDTTVCGATPILLDATTAGAQTYRWNDGYTLPQRSVTGTGEYSITAQGNGCTVSDTVRLQRFESLHVNLPGDTTICGQDTLWLDATTPYGDRYRWNDGFEKARRPVTGQGYYAVSVFRGECSASDFTAVNFFPRPAVLPADTSLCLGEPLTLTVGASVAGDIWWNGQRGYAEFPFEGAGWVRRLVTFQHCRFADSVLVRRVPCRDGFALYAPNVFAPGSDGPNAYFELFGDDLEVLHFQVFDRWGSLVYATNAEALPHWDGTSRGRGLPGGVYLWSAQLRQRGQVGWLHGDVLLVR